jgi:ProP effector
MYPNQRRIAHETRAILVERFPLAFCPKRQPKFPLKIGISVDLVARCGDLKWKHISLALRDYTSGATYLRGLVEGAPRIDLDGNTAGTVTAAHAARAKSRLEELEKRWAAAKPLPPKLGLSDLKAAALARKAVAA